MRALCPYVPVRKSPTWRFADDDEDLVDRRNKIFLGRGIWDKGRDEMMIRWGVLDHPATLGGS